MSRASVAPLSLDPKHVSCIRGRTVVTCSMCAGNAPRYVQIFFFFTYFCSGLAQAQCSGWIFFPICHTFIIIQVAKFVYSNLSNSETQHSLYISPLFSFFFPPKEPITQLNNPPTRDSVCSRCDGHGFNVFICATCNPTAVTAASSAKGAAVTNTSSSATSAASSAAVSTSSSRGASVSGSPSNSIGAGASTRSWGRSDRRDGHGPGGIGTRSSRGV